MELDTIYHVTNVRPESRWTDSNLSRRNSLGTRLALRKGQGKRKYLTSRTRVIYFFYPMSLYNIVSFSLSQISDQLVSTMPFRVYSRLALRLAGDRIDIASRLFNLCLEDAMALREITEHTRSLRQGVDIVFDMMIQRDVTLGQLVQVLKEMRRFDAIGLLTEAGYPDDNALGR